MRRRNFVRSTRRRRYLRARWKPILGRLGFVFRPLDQKPLFGAQLAQQVVAMRRPQSKHEDSQSAVPSRLVVVCQPVAEARGRTALTRSVDRLVLSRLQPRRRPSPPRWRLRCYGSLPSRLESSLLRQDGSARFPNRRSVIRDFRALIWLGCDSLDKAVI
jgi:hypothetical protein